jgi:uncharacterized membrane protein YhaH (DUF805 family)
MAELHVQRKRNNYWWLWLLIVVLIIAAGVYYYMNYYKKNTTTSSDNSTGWVSPQHKNLRNSFLIEVNVTEDLNSISKRKSHPVVFF